MLTLGLHAQLVGGGGGGGGFDVEVDVVVVVGTGAGCDVPPVAGQILPCEKPAQVETGSVLLGT